MNPVDSDNGDTARINASNLRAGEDIWLLTTCDEADDLIHRWKEGSGRRELAAPLRKPLINGAPQAPASGA